MTSGTPELPGLADLSPLGQGGLADVYLARQIHLERWVAAKVFRVTLDDEQAADRFRAECRALGRIDQYPNIITVYDAGVLPDGRPYLISERCDGSLADLVSVRGPLPAERVAELGLTVARALRHAHSAGVLHGDVTPQNVLLRSSGAPVLADFGLAVLRDQRTATAAGFTQAHAAPETLGGTHAIDERSDVYGLGSTLHAALTGRAPFPREPGEDDPEYVDRVRTEPVPEPDGPPPLTGLILAMLSKDPARRPGTDEVVETLGTLVAEDATQALRMPGASTAGWTGTARWTGPGDAATQAAHVGGPAERTRLQHGPQRTAATTAVPRPRRRRRGLLVGV
ncbi:serine/threonine-protein kinase, partial [Pseudonocardia sp. KRD291]|uniref:serine/threonine-protein kinase n=1 Tax=Pseudonocardia sp. KRD291 TaxID=2792007 RepID=UPI001C4A3424